MKKIILLGLVLMSSIGHAKMGSEGVGGGDLCEDRIQTVRDDLKNWISKDGSKYLHLGSGVSQSDYSQAMLNQIEKAKIKCVSQGDRDFPVEVNGTAKTCKFTLSETRSQITCDYGKFQAMIESDQYVLIHHEYAGLARIEVPNGNDSNYEISNQISGFLIDQVVKKLAVRPRHLTIMEDASIFFKLRGKYLEDPEMQKALQYLNLEDTSSVGRRLYQKIYSRDGSLLSVLFDAETDEIQSLAVSGDAYLGKLPYGIYFGQNRGSVVHQLPMNLTRTDRDSNKAIKTDVFTVSGLVIRAEYDENLKLKNVMLAFDPKYIVPIVPDVRWCIDCYDNVGGGSL